MARSFALVVLLSAAFAAASARHGHHVQVVQCVLALTPLVRAPAGLTRSVSLYTSVPKRFSLSAMRLPDLRAPFATCDPAACSWQKDTPTRSFAKNNAAHQGVKKDGTSCTSFFLLRSCAHPRGDKPRQQPAIDSCHCNRLPSSCWMRLLVSTAPVDPHLICLLLLLRPWPAPVHARPDASNVWLRGPGNYLQLLMHVIWLLEHRYQV